MADTQSRNVDIQEKLESNEVQSNTNEAPSVGFMTIEINSLDADSYADEIDKLCNNLKVRTVLDRPVLTPAISDKDPKYPGNVTFYDIILETDEKSDKYVQVTLRFRKDNLYLIGYRAMNGTWYEIGYKSELIAKSVPLKIGVNYRDLLKAVGIDTLTDFETPNYYSLRDATEGLANETLRLTDVIDVDKPDTNYRNRAKRLLRLAIMISEAARSVPVLEYLKGKFYGGLEYNDDDDDDDDDDLQAGAKIPCGVNKLVHLWENRSTVVIKGEANPERTLTEKEVVIVQIDSKPIEARTVLELSQIIGILIDNTQKKIPEVEEGVGKI